MKVARARYVGPMAGHTRAGPSGTTYEFTKVVPDGPRWVPIESVADARAFEDVDVLDVEWDPVGRVVAAGQSVTDALEEMGYQAKRKLAGPENLDLGLSGNPDEESLDAAIQAYVDDLDEAGDLEL